MDTLIVCVKSINTFEGVLDWAGACGLLLRAPVLYFTDLDEYLLVFGEEPDASAYLQADGTIRSPFLALQTIASSIEFQVFMEPEHYTFCKYIKRDTHGYLGETEGGDSRPTHSKRTRHRHDA